MSLLVPRNIQDELLNINYGQSASSQSQACFPKINRAYKQHCAGATTFSETTLQQDLVLCSDLYVSSGLRYLWRPVAVKTVTAPNLVAKAGVMSSEMPFSRCSPGALLRMQLNLRMQLKHASASGSPITIWTNLSVLVVIYLSAMLPKLRWRP